MSPKKSPKSSAKNKGQSITARTLDAMQDDLNKVAHASHHDPFNVLGNQAIHHKDFLLFYSHRELIIQTTGPC